MDITVKREWGMGNGEWGMENGNREILNFQFDSNSFNRFLPPIPSFRQGQESVFLSSQTRQKSWTKRKNKTKSAKDKMSRFKIHLGQGHMGFMGN